MHYYDKYWKERNEIKFKPEIQRKYVIEWYEKEILNAKMHWAESVRKYIREYELNTENRETDQIQRWLIGLIMVKKEQ